MVRFAANNALKIVSKALATGVEKKTVEFCINKRDDLPNS